MDAPALSDAEIDALFSATGLSVPEMMHTTVRQTARDLKEQARLLSRFLGDAHPADLEPAATFAPIAMRP